MTQSAEAVRAKVRAIYFEREAKIDARRWEAYEDQFAFRDALGSDEAYNVLFFGEGWFGNPGPRGLPSDFEDRVDRAVAALLTRHRAKGDRDRLLGLRGDRVRCG
jgi:hypothetical protein